MDFNLLIALCVGLLAQQVFCGELTFELPDNEKMCFHENINAGVESTLEFQVVMGGNYDVDMELSAPNGQILYKDTKKQYDSFTWTPSTKGIYTFCFSNEFSTFTHKVVYFDLQVGEDKPVVEQKEGEQAKAMTLIESSSVNIFKLLKEIMELQNFFRLREMQGRWFAEELSGRVVMWSVGQALLMVGVGVGQILILRSFFVTEHKTSAT